MNIWYLIAHVHSYWNIVRVLTEWPCGRLRHRQSKEVTIHADHDSSTCSNWEFVLEWMCVLCSLCWETLRRDVLRMCGHLCTTWLSPYMRTSRWRSGDIGTTWHVASWTKLTVNNPHRLFATWGEMKRSCVLCFNALCSLVMPADFIACGLSSVEVWCYFLLLKS